MDELSMIKRGDHVQIFHVHKLERGGKYTLPIALTVDKKCPVDKNDDIQITHAYVSLRAIHKRLRLENQTHNLYGDNKTLHDSMRACFKACTIQCTPLSCHPPRL